MNILVIGNCQANSLALMFEPMLEKPEVAHIQLLPANIPDLNSGALRLPSLKSGDAFIGDLAINSDLILIQNGHEIMRLFEAEFPTEAPKVRMFPRMMFSGFHPDMITSGRLPPCATGPFHSSIACYGWSNGLSEEETIGLYREDVFAELGFFNYWKSSVDFLLQESRKANLPLDEFVPKWTSQGTWMHTINHPKLNVVADVARAILRREGIPFIPEVESSLADPLVIHATWSVFPEVARRIGVEGDYRFKRGGELRADHQGPPVYDLEQFVRISFDQYTRHKADMSSCERLSSPRYQQLKRFVRKAPERRVMNEGRSRGVETTTHEAVNPYQNLPDHQFWRRGIERPAMTEVDPVVAASFKLGREDKVATAGSCFAQHIARTLVKNGFNYYVAEAGEGLDAEEAQRRNFGVFSARFGNLYTTRQLLQLFYRAYGLFKPADNAWVRSDGRLVDPFRPQVEPEGFATVEELEASRVEHYAAVREMFERCDVFVFTLGLTESWRSRVDGAVFPLAPGVVAGAPDPERYEFINFSAGEVTADLQAFIDRLRGVNPAAKVILTVSPVPLIATYEDRHVLVSTTYSKSALRVAAEEVCQRNPRCAYFPSYEIITGNYTRSEYYESDLRSVKQAGVDHVMRLFLKHYGSSAGAPSLEEELMRENEAVADVVCDEEAIEG